MLKYGFETKIKQTVRNIYSVDKMIWATEKKKNNKKKKTATDKNDDYYSVL